jgi:hypothetical protein
MGPVVIAATLAELRLPVPIYLAQPKLTEDSDKKAKKRPREVATFDRFIDELRMAQQQLTFPPGYNPLDKDHAPTQQFLQRLGIQDFWKQDASTMAAFEYLREPHMCRMLQTMLLGPLGFVAISRRLASKFQLPPSAMNPQIVRAFSHYFWNYDNLNKPEWEHLLWDWIPGDTWDLHMALRAPRSTVGAAMVLHTVDQGGSDSLKEVLMYRFLRDVNFMEIVKSAIGMPTGVGKAQAMMFHTQAMIQGQEQLDMRRGGSAELLEELRRIEATYDPRRLTTVQELPLHQLTPGVIDVEHEEVK